MIAFSSNKILRAGLILVALSFAGTSAAQQTYRLSKAPFYKTFDKKAKPTAGTRFVHLPFAIDKFTDEEFFFQGREKVLLPLTDVLNRYLDSLSWSSAISPDAFPAPGAPSLFVGSSESVTAPPSAEMLREEYDTYPPMAMHVNKPGKAWKTALGKTLIDSRADYMLVFWIGFNEYPKAKKGVFKKKVVLGTDYEPEIRFLSDELEPVEVLQISGMMIDKKGNIVRAGAEAFIYEDSPFWVLVLGAATSIDDNTIQRSIMEIRRDDLPGNPPAWRVALYNLVQQLTNRPKSYSS